MRRSTFLARLAAIPAAILGAKAVQAEDRPDPVLAIGRSSNNYHDHFMDARTHALYTTNQIKLSELEIQEMRHDRLLRQKVRRETEAMFYGD